MPEHSPEIARRSHKLSSPETELLDSWHHSKSQRRFVHLDAFPRVGHHHKSTLNKCQMLKPATSTSAVRRTAVGARVSPLKRPSSSARQAAVIFYRSRSTHTVSALAPALSSPTRSRLRDTVNTKNTSRAFASAARMVENLSPNHRIPAKELQTACLEDEIEDAQLWDLRLTGTMYRLPRQGPKAMPLERYR